MTEPAGPPPDPHPPTRHSLAARLRVVSPRARRWAAGIVGSALIAIAAVAILGALREAPGDAGPLASHLGPGPHLVLAEFGAGADTLYATSADAPDRRTRLARVDHAEGWGINPAPAMAGSLVAYTVLPVGSAARRDAPAELWVLDIETQNHTRLARDADLLAPPLIDGEAVVYRSSSLGGRQEIVRVDLETRARTTIHTYEGGFGIFPVGLMRDDTVVFATYSPEGTDLYRLTPGEEPEFIAHATDHVARDLRLSPDGETLAYVAPQQVGERYLHRLQVLDLRSGEPRITTDVADIGTTAEQFAPVWSPDGTALTVGQEVLTGRAAAAVMVSADGGDRAADRPRLLPAPAAGFDVPLGWSSDGQYLATRSFSGVGASEPGTETLVIVDPTDGRVTIPTATELLYLGWYAGG